MRLLLTRAVGEAIRTREILEAAGYAVVLSPVIEIAALTAPWPTGVVDGIIATSGQAFMAMIGGSEPSPEIRRLMPLYLVGPRTAEAAVKSGFTGAATVETNATALAILLAKGSHRPRTLVYLAGRDRKPDIETALAVLGQRVHVAEIYEAQAVETMTIDAQTAWSAREIDGVLHYSHRSAALFLRQTEKAGLDPRSAHHFCLSADVAIPLRDAGCSTIHICEEPNETALLALVKVPS